MSRRIQTLFLTGCAWLLAACSGVTPDLSNIEAPKVSLTSIQAKNLDLYTPSFLVGLRVDNPNDVQVELSGAEAALALNGQQVAMGISQSPLTLNRRGSSDLAVEVKANTIGLLQQVLALANQQSIPYQVTGRLRLARWLGYLGEFPFSFSGTLDRDSLLSGATLP